MSIIFNMVFKAHAAVPAPLGFLNRFVSGSVTRSRYPLTNLKRSGFKLLLGRAHTVGVTSYDLSWSNHLMYKADVGLITSSQCPLKSLTTDKQHDRRAGFQKGFEGLMSIS